MKSIINDQPFYIQQLSTPQVTDTLTTPSLTPNVGCIAYDKNDPSSIYVGNGSVWNKVVSSGSTGGLIDNGVVSNSSLPNNTITNSTITFPTEGGSPETLNFYEVYSGEHVWSGIWSSSITARVTYIRLGKLILVSFQQAVDRAESSGIIVSDKIPERFKPSQTGINSPFFPIYGVSNEIGITPYITYDTENNRWVIYESAQKAYIGDRWTGSGISGLLESCFVYPN